MPIRFLPAVVLAILFLQGASTALQASNTTDSLRYVLDADATAGERARALCTLSSRVLPHDPATALAHAVNAVRMAEMDGDLRLTHEALAAQRAAQLRLGMVPERLSATLRSVQIAKTISDPSLLAADLQELSFAYGDAERPDQAVEHARQALAISLPTHDALAITRAERILMEALLRAGRHQEVIRSADRALANAGSLPPIEQALVRSLVARSFIAQRRFSDALPYLVTAERVIQKDGTQQDRFAIALDMAAWATNVGRIAEGQAHLRDAEALATELPGQHTVLPLLHARHQLAAATQDWKDAHGLMVAIATKSDSLQRASCQLVLAGMLVAHDLEAKESDRKEMADRAARTEALLSDQLKSNHALIVALALLALLSIAMLILARRHQRSAKRNKLKGIVIQRQKEELQARSLELQRQNMRLAETMMREERHGIALGEMHHRLKNNLQAIDALLQMQCGSLTDPAAERLLREAQGRLRAMAVVHQTIYRMGDDNALPLLPHLKELARNVLVAHGRHDRVSVLIDGDGVELNASDLLPLSLLFNELLTNSLKHAIPSEAHGTIRIVVKQFDHALEIRFCDDSTVRPAGLSEGSFGMELMHALASQLNGSIAVIAGLQTTFCLQLAPESIALRKAS